jgi:hypothetical protein
MTFEDNDESVCLLVRLLLVFDEGDPIGIGIGKHIHLWDMPNEGDHIVDQELCNLLDCDTEIVINTIDHDITSHPLATCYPCKWTGVLSDLYPYILTTGWSLGIDEEKN